MSKLHLDDFDRDFLPALIARLAELRAASVQVQSQPLGCMRLPLQIGQKNADAGQFLHVWVPGLPIQQGGPFHHTHVFHLRSRVVVGGLLDTTYKVVDDPNGDYRFVTAMCAEDFCQPRESQRRGYLRVDRELRVLPGGSYSVEKGIFHSTKPEVATVTVFEKSDVDRGDPILAIPIDVKVPTDEFRRDQLDQTFAWLQIEKLIRQQAGLK